MKLLIHLACLICSLLFTLSSRAQDEDCPVCGWYVDGVKADKIDCYSFDKLQLVLPYNSGFDAYDKICIWVNLVADEKDVKWLQSSSQASGVKTFPGKAVKTLVKGGYIVYTVFSKELGQRANLSLRAYGSYENWGTDLYRVRLKATTKKMSQKKGDPAPDLKLYCYLEALTISGYTETYDPNTQKVTREPQYTPTMLSKTYPLVCTKRVLDSYMGSDEVDMTPPCSVPGTKVDFNNLGKPGSSTTVKDEKKPETLTPETPKTTTVPKTTTSPKTTTPSGKTIITSAITKTNTTVKPIDKTKPGYFEEKNSDGKLAIAGYKKGENYHGEVREYNSDGTVDVVAIYTDGIQDGLYMKFDDEGKLENSGTYKQGNQDGIWQWYSNGTLTKTIKYVNGEEQE